jgi:signal transduction histidine kinase
LNLLRVFVHRPVVLPLAIATAVSMVAISEVAYWQSTASLAAMALELQVADTTSLAQHRLDLQHTLRLARAGVAMLTLISLFALYMVLRQTLMLQRVAQDHSDTLEATVAQRTAELLELTHHLQTAREDERSRLARDLHDELGALLTSAKLDAARIRARLVTAGQPEVLERLAHLVSSLDSVITLKRRITEDLRPSALTHLGLVSTLQMLADDFAQASGLRVHCTLAPVRLAAPAELMVYRLVQEGINNISKHAKAGQVWLGLQETGGQVELTLCDDGVGFDMQSPGRTTHGLLGMRYRVQAEHGSLQLRSAPGAGTLISVRLPLAAAT